MPYQMTQEEANNYALRMFNDDYWDKNYTANLDGLKLLENIEHGVHLELPIVLKTERHCVGEDDDDEYADRPNAMNEDLADDDNGIISIPFTLAIAYPIKLNGNDVSNIDSLIKNLGISIKEIGCAAMYDGTIKLDSECHNHLINRINSDYMILDTIDQNYGLIDTLVNKAKDLTVEEDSKPHTILA